MSTKQGIHSCHWCQRTNMSTKCKILMNCSKSHMTGKTNMTEKWGIFKRSSMWINKYGVQTWHFMGINFLYTYTCLYNFKCISINHERETCLLNKEYISEHKWEIINMVVRFIVHMHITAELKAYWPLALLLLLHPNNNITYQVLFCLSFLACY